MRVGESGRQSTRTEAKDAKGSRLNRTVLTLRGWQCEPQGRMTPWEVIVAERDELLARRARLLQGAADSS